ncbi:uncharacterized protein EAE97_011897 [Botrytis byssoidea]|uniref:N-acetyltransferase domain-containing protein n=1 Tax=Botrytis byssoidea TaxID=139641 RepID=A0A9P5HRV8_9HELO|nr:uncharacterized protein EAE97_011897 [Botrytis byssoidea]KAF7918126.1 hypothetical protein EAE97_011897 [Botrytis byssoidea]
MSQHLPTNHAKQINTRSSNCSVGLVKQDIVREEQRIPRRAKGIFEIWRKIKGRGRGAHRAILVFLILRWCLKELDVGCSILLYEEKRMNKNEKRTHPNPAAQVILTLPSHRHLGIGNLIPSWVIRKVDELGLDCHVEGSRTGVALYTEHGFEKIRNEEGTPYKEEHSKSEEWKGFDEELVEVLTVMRRPCRKL